MQNVEKIEGYLHLLSPKQRAAVLSAALSVHDLPIRQQRRIGRALLGIVEATARTERRRASDRETEPRRRVTIGARVKREFAARCQAAAEASGRSMYRFLHDALERECLAVEKGGDL